MRILNNCFRWIRIALLPLGVIKGHYYMSRKAGLSRLGAFPRAYGLYKKASRDSRVLSRPGVSIPKEQKEQIESLVEAGRMTEAQQIVLGILNKEFGDS